MPLTSVYRDVESAVMSVDSAIAKIEAIVEAEGEPSFFMPESVLLVLLGVSAALDGVRANLHRQESLAQRFGVRLLRQPPDTRGATSGATEVA